MKTLLHKLLCLLHIKNKKITLQKALDDNLVLISIIYPKMNPFLPTITHINDYINEIKIIFGKLEYERHNKNWVNLISYTRTITDKQEYIWKESREVYNFKKNTYIIKNYTGREKIFTTTTKKEALNFLNQLIKTNKEFLKTYLDNPHNQDYYKTIKYIKNKIFKLIMKINGFHVQTSYY